MGSTLTSLEFDKRLFWQVMVQEGKGLKVLRAKEENRVLAVLSDFDVTSEGVDAYLGIMEENGIPLAKVASAALLGWLGGDSDHDPQLDYLSETEKLGEGCAISAEEDKKTIEFIAVAIRAAGFEGFDVNRISVSD